MKKSQKDSRKMTASHLLKILPLSFLFVMSACAADSSLDELVPIENTTAVHILPIHTPGTISNAAPPGAHLMNFGGPTLNNIQVAPLYWNSNVQFQSNLDLFYNDVPSNSPLYSMLSQYGIGSGSGRAGFVDNRTTTSVSDPAVQIEVLNQINAGHLPPPNANTYYPVHFPSGVTIVGPPNVGTSCIDFCAYHGTFQVQNSVGTVFNVNYGVVPDLGGGCAGRCGNNAQLVNNLDSVSSHELCEATTDPAVGIATHGFAFPLAWYDPGINGGEIGDLCNGLQGTTTGNGRSYVIQLEFSNTANDCVQQ
jgi:hypothetical protein